MDDAFWTEESRRWREKRREMDMILVNQDRVVMSEKCFRGLDEYSTTLPTGTPFGKIWKRHDFARDKWFLGEYYDIDSPTEVGIRWREIEVV